jgi:hypothetical protein
VIENALDDDYYDMLYNEYPSDRQIVEHDFYADSSFEDAKENTRYQISAKSQYEKTVQLPSIWQDFIYYHTSQEYLNEVLNIFSPVLSDCYPDLFKKNRSPRFRAGVRRYKDRRKDCDIAMDCQVGINTPLSELGRVLGPHLDNPVELYAGLLYFKDPNDASSGGDLVVSEWSAKDRQVGAKGRIEDQYVREVARVPYEPNKFVMFLNTIDSVHGVTPRQPTTYSRKLVNIIGEVFPFMPEGLFLKDMKKKKKKKFFGVREFIRGY